MVADEVFYRPAAQGIEAALELRVPKTQGYGVLRISYSTLAAITGIRSASESEMRGAFGKVMRGIAPRIARLAAGVEEGRVLELTPEDIKIEVPD